MKKLVSIFLSAVIICGLLLISACDRTEDVRKSDGAGVASLKVLVWP